MEFERLMIDCPKALWHFKQLMFGAPQVIYWGSPLSPFRRGIRVFGPFIPGRVYEYFLELSHTKSVSLQYKIFVSHWDPHSEDVRHWGEASKLMAERCTNLVIQIVHTVPMTPSVQKRWIDIQHSLETITHEIGKILHTWKTLRGHIERDGYGGGYYDGSKRDVDDYMACVEAVQKSADMMYEQAKNGIKENRS
jgi:hypothetical protein